jgi:hypothetical protein
MLRGDGFGAESTCHLAIAVAIEVEEEKAPQVRAVPFVPAKKAPFHRSKLFCRIAFIILSSIIVIGAATIAIVLVAAGDHDNNNGGEGGYRETLGIRQEIEALVGTEELGLPDSPYSKALEWMIHQDPMKLVPGVDSNLVQRFIMAYFYYATTTNGPWQSCNPAVGSESESCDLSVVNYIFEVRQGKQIPATRWLSLVHECQFAGVVCNDQRQVIKLNLSKFRFSVVARDVR